MHNYILEGKTPVVCHSIIKWGEWFEKVPFIPFPIDLEVRLVPPHGGALVRFHVRKRGEEKILSIYLDVWERLGCGGGPYWEIYPVGDECVRVGMYDTEDLISVIQGTLNEPRGGIESDYDDDDYVPPDNYEQDDDNYTQEF